MAGRMAGRSRGLMQEVAASIGDAYVYLLDAGPRLLPVVAELLFAAHGPLITSEALLVFLEAVEGFDEAAIA